MVYEELSITLAEINDVPLFKMMYLIKETLIGLERLFSKFGAFLFTEAMVFVDQSGKCKVWINERVEANNYEPTELK